MHGQGNRFRQTVDISDFLLMITILPLAGCFHRHFLAFVCLFSHIFSHGNTFKYLCVVLIAFIQL